MEHCTFDEAEFRFGEYGPGYLMRGPRTDVGIVRLTPGTEAGNHYHAQIEETFYVLKGTATMWLDCRESFELKPGDVYRADPGEMHYFINNSEVVFEAIFIKAPYSPSDVIPVPWTVGEELPPLINQDGIKKKD